MIRENPWATLVSSREGELVASRYPILLDESSDELAVVTHVGRPDDQVHGFGDDENATSISRCCLSPRRPLGWRRGRSASGCQHPELADEMERLLFDGERIENPHGG